MGISGFFDEVKSKEGSSLLRRAKGAINRRDLFRPPKKGASVRVSPRISPRIEAETTDLLRVRRSAMATFFDVRLGARTPGGFELASEALDLIADLEGQLTVYRDDSELSRINATAHLGPVEAEEGLFGLLQTAEEIHALTAGAFDATSGALSVAWGFFKGPKRVPDRETLEDARARTGQALVTLDPEKKTVFFKRAGVTINLGGIGKGYAIDRAVDLIRRRSSPTSALIHGGQSSLYALGGPPGDFGGGWEVALRNPFDPERPLGRIRLRDRGLGTSGAAFQSFEAEGRRYGHILDPRTGEPSPASASASVTVLAPSATWADALSTAFYLLGPVESAEILKRLPQVSAIFVEAGPSIRGFNLSELDFEPDPRRFATRS